MFRPPKKRTEKPPKFLHSTTRQWWKSVNDAFVLDDHHRLLLNRACVALERTEEARQVLASEGSYFVDRLGSKKAHPAVAVELQNSRLFASLLRELGLDVTSAEAPRPPQLPGYGAR